MLNKILIALVIVLIQSFIVAIHRTEFEGLNGLIGFISLVLITLIVM